MVPSHGTRHPTLLPRRGRRVYTSPSRPAGGGSRGRGSAKGPLVTRRAPHSGHRAATPCPAAGAVARVAGRFAPSTPTHPRRGRREAGRPPPPACGRGTGGGRPWPSEAVIGPGALAKRLAAGEGGFAVAAPVRAPLTLPMGRLRGCTLQPSPPPSARNERARGPPPPVFREAIGCLPQARCARFILGGAWGVALHSAPPREEGSDPFVLKGARAGWSSALQPAGLPSATLRQEVWIGPRERGSSSS